MIRECDVCGSFFIVEKVGQGPCAQCARAENAEEEGKRKLTNALEFANEEIDARIDYMHERLDLLKDELERGEGIDTDELERLIRESRINNPKKHHIEEDECES